MLTMTETWMSGRGVRQDDLYGAADSSSVTATGDPHRHMRSSLGQLIERSISAPPSSDVHDDGSNPYAMRGVSFFVLLLLV